MRNTAISETALLREAQKALEDRMPSGWLLSISVREHKGIVPKAWADMVLEVNDPEGRSALVAVEIKRRPVEAREVAALADRWRRLISNENPTEDGVSNVNLMLVSPFLGASTRERLTEQGISFADSTGNLRFVLARPAVFIEAEGAGKNPWRETFPLRSLKGRGAARAVRAFLDYRPPFGIRELASATGSSPASISRVADLLEREAILNREGRRGRVLAVDWERLLRRWGQDYKFVAANSMRIRLDPRGARSVLDKLRAASFKYAVTGSFATVRFAPVAQPRLIALYVEDPDVAEGDLGLRQAETGGNVLFGKPFDPVVFDRTNSLDGLTYTAASQVAADLLTGPGRGPGEAESLIEWMRANEDVWRISLNPNS